MAQSKNALSSITIVAVLGEIVNVFIQKSGLNIASEEVHTVMSFAALVLALWGRWRVGDLHLKAPSSAKLLAVSLLLMSMLTATGCVGQTAAAQWAEQRSTLTAYQDSAVEAHKANVINDEALRAVRMSAILARNVLARAELELPRKADGSIDLEATAKTPALQALLREAAALLLDIKALLQERKDGNPRSNRDHHQSGWTLGRARAPAA